MRKLIVTCECGQRLRVPYSALGKTGICVTCGRTIQIMANNTRRDGGPVRDEPPVGRDTRWQRRTPLTEDAKQRFGKAVDLFNQHHYAEALAIFDSFLAQFPGNPEIEEARAQCLNALKRPRIASPETMRGPASEPRLDADAVKRIVLEKMMYDPSSAVQIEAAKLASQILGLTGNHPAETGASGECASRHEAHGASETTWPEGMDEGSQVARGGAESSSGDGGAEEDGRNFDAYVSS